MALFQYHALTKQGHLMKGSLEASGKEQAQQILSEMNLDIQFMDKDNTR